MLCLFLFSAIAQAQVELSEELTREYIEEIITTLEDADVDNLEFVVQLMAELSRRPLDINRADLSVLADATFISNDQLIALKAHIEKHGPLLAIYELQTIPGWDLNSIRRIRPFIRINRDLDDIHMSAKDLISESTLSIRSYVSRRYPEARGGRMRFDSLPTEYEGDAFRHYINIRAQYQYRFSIGMTAEKDAGEAFFNKSNSGGYDYTSFHAYGQSINKHVRLLALGDYKVNMGQGLIMHNGFGGNKSAFVSDIKKGGKLFRPHSSTSEYNYYRGGAVEFNVFKDWHVGAFYSSIQQDANINVDTTDDDVTIRIFTSLQASGLHRTKNEIEDEDQVRYQAVGGRIGLEKPKYNIHINAVQHSFSAPFIRSPQPYNQFQFRFSKLQSASLDYSYSLGQLHVFGESAVSDNGVMAHLIGAKVGLSKRIKWASLYRYYPRDYLSILANAFGERRLANNEIGFYNGVTYEISSKVQLSGYIDLWKNPWLQFNIDALTAGKEYLFKFRYYQKRKLEAYAQYRFEEKAVASRFEKPFTGIDLRRRNQLRCHLNYKVNKELEWRSRVEFNRLNFEDHESDGFLIFQDFIYKPIESPISFTTRYLFFSTDDFDSRIYTFENHLLFNYSLPGFFGTGHRFYINLRYRPIKPLTLELRYAQTSFTDRDVIGSGTETRQGNSIRQIAAQVRWVFD
jgi:hypothetical protein